MTTVRIRATILLALWPLCRPLLASEPVPSTPGPHQLEFREHLRQRAAAQLEAFMAEHGDSLAATAAEVLARHVEATGGRQAWLAVRSLEIRFRALDTGAGDAILVRQYRRPLHFRQHLEGSGVARVTDGWTVWQVGPEGWREVELEGFANMASLDHHTLDPARGGVEHELVGVEIVNHTPVYHLRASFTDGYREELYFGVESGLLVERYTDYLSGPSWFSYWDYRDVGGVKIPHVHIRSVNELGPPHGVGVLEVTLNPDLPDSLFLPPERVGR
jgi:hypothetical protein